MANSNQGRGNSREHQVIDLFDPHQAMRRSHAQSTTATFVSNRESRPSVATTHFRPPHHLSQHYATGTPSPVDSGIAPFTPVVQPESPVSQDPSQSKPSSSVTEVIGMARKKRARPSSNSGKRKRVESARRSGRSPNVSYLLAGGSLLAGLVVVGDVGTLFESKAVSHVCQQVIQEDAALSRENLSRLIAIPERDAKSSVREVVSEPYCVLPSVEIRSGAIAEREAYPLAFDPQTWVVLLYEGDEYAGYSFSFQP